MKIEPKRIMIQTQVKQVNGSKPNPKFKRQMWAQAQARQTNGPKPKSNKQIGQSSPKKSWNFSINRDFLIHFEDLGLKEELRLSRIEYSNF